jgi:plastocyanin
MRALCLACLAAVAVAAAVPTLDPQAATGAIEGRVTIRAPLVSPAVDGQPASRPREHRQAIVFLEMPPSRVDGLSTIRVAMRQRGATFEPHVLAVTVGTTVAFPNDDRTYHNVFSLSRPRRFDLGRYAAGRSKDVRFERAGLVRVFCDIHAHMNAFIFVFDHRFYAATDEDGRYRIDRVPPGGYRVTAWYEGVDQMTLPVTVAAGGAVALDFQLH